MKKSIKKLAAAGLSFTSIASLVACGSAATTTQKTTEGNQIAKPDLITVMEDNTVTESNGAEAFYDYMEQLTGLNIKWIHPDHSGYYDTVANAFTSEDTMPDVVLLSSDYYSVYASNGMLWNMTDAYNNSDLKKSGRLVSTANDVVNACYVLGEDGKKALYGFPTQQGGGSVTYVKSSWLKQAGINPSDLEGKTLDWNTYYGYLKKMADAKQHYVISSPGFVSPNAPYTNYLPEFYQNAQFSFYQTSDGKYVDGFTEQYMKDALARIRKGVEDGVLDKESVNNSTANCRDKWFSVSPDSESGVFTYWAGDWTYTMKSTLEKRNLDTDVIMLNPIKELGAYLNTLPTTWSITTACKNPEGVFKYFIETMLDGGDIQEAWTYGAKGTHWDTKAETVTLQDSDTSTTYKEGEFHHLPSPEKPYQLQMKNHIDPLLALAKYQNTSTTPNGDDPGSNVIPEVSKTAEQFFLEHSKMDVALPVNADLSENITDINQARTYVVSQVALGYMTVDEGMDYYRNTVGSKVDTVVRSLNK